VARRYLQQDADARFVLYGDGPLRRTLERRIRAIGMEGRILLEGTVVDSIDALSEMDAMLLTSDVEGTPNAVLEAQPLGVPVVARPVGGMREAIPPELSGLLAEGETGLVTALRRAVALDRTMVSRIARSFIGERFDPARQTQEYAALYDHVAAQDDR